MSDRAEEVIADYFAPNSDWSKPARLKIARDFINHLAGREILLIDLQQVRESERDAVRRLIDPESEPA